MFAWTVHYINGDTFSNEDGEPQDAPGGGVLAVAQRDDTVNTAVHEGSDFYVFGEEYGGWCGMNEYGFVPYVMRPGLKIIKLGESMTTARYRALIDSIRKDPKLPDKTARYPWERPF